MPGLGIAATFCGMIFTGAAVYVTLVEHPARLECGTALAVTEFGPSYRRAARIQASLALLSALFAVGAWLKGGSMSWLVGGAFICAVVPFTFVAIMPTNKRLLSPDLAHDSAEARILLVRWGRLHGVRSLLSLIAAVIFLHALQG